MFRTWVWLRRRIPVGAHSCPNETRRQEWRRLEWFAFSVLLVGVIVPALVLAPTYAPWHDELWNLPGAWTIVGRGSLPHSWTFELAGRVLPLVDGPYQGAVKSYIMAPWILVFGTGTAMLRLFNALIGVALGLGCFWAIRPAVSRGVAVVGLLMPLVFTNFSFSGQSDHGPFLIGSLSLVLTAGCLVRAWRTPRQRWLVGAAFFLGLTLGDKLTTAPIVVVGSVAVVFLVIVRRSVYLRPLPLIASVVSAVVPVLPFVVYFLREGTAEFRGMTVRTGAEYGYLETLRLNMSPMRRALLNTSDAQLLVNVTSRRLTSVPELGTAVLWVIALCGVGWLVLMVLARRPAACALFIAWPIGAYLLYPLFGELNRPWHFLPLLPLVFLGLVCFVFQFGEALRSIGRYARPVAFAAMSSACAVLVASSFVAQSEVARAGGRNIASPGLYEIANVVRSTGRHEIICLDYSVCHPLRAVLGMDYEIVTDLAFASRDDSLIDSIRAAIGGPSRILVVRIVDEEVGLTAGVPTSFTDFLNSGSEHFLASSLNTDGQLTNVGARDVNGAHFSLYIAP